MNWSILFMLIGFVFQMVWAPPVTQKKPDDNTVDGDSPVKENLEDYMEYHRYLNEVVQALESDPEFRAKLEKADNVDIRSGKIAQELEYVNHNVRSKLDELKRQELERLRHLANRQYELSNDIDTYHAKIQTQVEHLDHNNPHTFEIEDLKKLIKKTTEDLAEADMKRREDFKQYEMQKEFEKQQKLQGLDDEHRKEFEKEIHDKEEKHKKHEPLHHPGSRQQLEEVWEKQDHMDNQDFNPKAFFMLHDVDGNGVWDETEVKALFLKELDKMYEHGAPEDDMRERQEEMERMREHVFKEADTNHDGLISYEEFLIQTRRAEFQKDQGWKGLDEEQVYTPEEYREFERRRLEEVQKMIDQGLIPPQPMYGGHPNDLHYPQQGYPQYQQQQYHPNAIPQGQYQPNFNQPPQAHGQYPQGQPPYMQYPQGQAQHPQGQIHYPQGQVPHPQGQIQQPHGQIKQQQGQIQQQGHVQHPQGQIQQQGQQNSQGQAQQPQVQQSPQVQAQQAHGQAQPAHGQAQQAHGQVQQAQQAQGGVQPPQGQMQHPQAQHQSTEGGIKQQPSK